MQFQTIIINISLYKKLEYPEQIMNNQHSSFMIKLSKDVHWGLSATINLSLMSF